MYVLDSSAFINEYHTDEQIATIPLVREELEDEAAYRFDALEGSGMHLHIPEDNTVERIERAASETGDLAELSETDIRLIAAAFELDSRLVTDDYAMQNVAEKLDVSVEVIAREG
ncbi:MAG: DNA-binding protein, partial [Haloarcula sp.]